MSGGFHESEESVRVRFVWAHECVRCGVQHRSKRFLLGGEQTDH